MTHLQFTIHKPSYRSRSRCCSRRRSYVYTGLWLWLRLRLGCGKWSWLALSRLSLRLPVEPAAVGVAAVATTTTTSTPTRSWSATPSWHSPVIPYTIFGPFSNKVPCGQKRLNSLNPIYVKLAKRATISEPPKMSLLQLKTVIAKRESVQRDQHIIVT